MASAVGLRVSRYSAEDEVRKLAANFKQHSTDPRLQAQFERDEKTTLPPSDYKALRDALSRDDFKTARSEYDKLREAKTGDVIERAFANPHPFAGSATTEFKFWQSLSPDERKLFNQAKAERAALYRKLTEMLRTTKSTQSVAKPRQASPS